MLFQHGFQNFTRYRAFAKSGKHAVLLQRRLLSANQIQVAPSNHTFHTVSCLAVGSQLSTQVAWSNENVIFRIRIDKSRLQHICPVDKSHVVTILHRSDQGQRRSSGWA